MTTRAAMVEAVRRVAENLQFYLVRRWERFEEDWPDDERERLAALTAAAEALAAEAWRPMTQPPPCDGRPIEVAKFYEGGCPADIAVIRFEMVEEDEEDGPWDIRDGEPWCSYEGRAAGVYCNWISEVAGERWDVARSSAAWVLSYFTHWRPLPPPAEAG